MSREKVRDIGSARRSPDPAVLALLKGLVADTERGEIVSITIAAEQLGGDVLTASAGKRTIANHLYALELVRLRLLKDGCDAD